MATTAPNALVTGQPRVPLPFGLFSTFTPRTGAGDRWESGGVQWEYLDCEGLQGIEAWQCPSDETEGLPKTLTSATDALPAQGTYGTANMFTVYGHVTVSPIGWTQEQAQARAEQQLLAREEARVEQAFWTGDLNNTPSLQGATDLSVASAGMVQSLGLLEDWIAANYGSLGIIHMTRGAALSGLAHNLLKTSGGRLFTSLGTPVAAGAGYTGVGPALEAAAAGTSWMYVTPALFGYRSEVIFSSNKSGDLFDRATNVQYAVAERSYLLGFDPCGVATALTSLIPV